MEDRRVASITVPARIESVRPAAAFLVDAARRLRVPSAENTLFEVAIVEALSNALEHNIRNTEGTLTCEIEVVGRRLIVCVLDNAASAPPAITLPTGAIPWAEATADSWETIPETGYGLYLIRAVFPRLTPVTREGRHGIEMELTF